MSHFYNCENEPFLTKAATPAQAKKVGAFPSVTTVMGIIKDPFLDGIWAPQQYIDLAREFPRASQRQIETRKYGMRTSPIDGEEITSSEFGTTVHKRLEDHTNAILANKKPKLDSVWDEWAEPFLKYITDESIEPVASELITWDNEIKVAGSVDFVGKLPDGKYFMADYKCRDCKGRGGKFYEKKDCTQLAIESWMLARMWDLEYLPSIMSVCVDIRSKKHYHKEWTWKQMQKGIERFKLTSEIYWMDFMNVQ